MLKAHIDTGGYKSLGITREALAKLEVEFTGTTTTRTDLNGERFEGRDFIIPELRLGGHIFRNVPGYERGEANSGVTSGFPFDVVVGRDFLGQYAVIVDYPANRIELHDPATKPCSPGDAALARNADGLWMTTVGTDRTDLQMVWDTGAKGASFVQLAVAEARKLPVEDDVYLTAAVCVRGPERRPD